MVAIIDRQKEERIRKAVERVFAAYHRAPSGDDIVEQGLAIIELLLDKNSKYGDSALSPKRIFSHADAAEQILVRIDDKLSRIANSGELPDEDTVFDLIGYLVLFRIAKARQSPPSEAPWFPVPNIALPGEPGSNSNGHAAKSLEDAESGFHVHTWRRSGSVNWRCTECGFELAAGDPGWTEVTAELNPKSQEPKGPRHEVYPQHAPGGEKR